MKSVLLIMLMACVASANADVDPVVYVKDALAKGRSTIVVPKNVYEIEPDGPQESVYFRLRGLRDVTIDFSGSKLIGKVATTLFSIEGCTNLVLRNFTVDYSFLPFTQAVIEKMDAEKNWDVRVIDGYPVPDITYGAGGLKGHNDFWPIQVYDGKTHEWVNPLRFLDGVAIVRTGERTYRITGGIDRTGKAGDIAVWSIKQRDRPTIGECFLSRGCANCLFEDITLYSTPHMGRAFIEFDACGNVYRRCRLRRCPPEEDTVRRGLKRLRSGSYDGFICKNSYKGFTLDDCEVAYNCDDCVNISGMYCLVSACDGERLRVLGNWMDVVCNAGDAVQVMDYDGTTLEAVVKEWKAAGTVNAEERKWLDDDKASGLSLELGKGVRKAFDVALDRPLRLKRGAVIISHNRMGDGFRIVNCRFGHSRVRGLLLKASHGLVENCVIEDCAAGIAISTEYNWLSGGCSSDVTVRGCTIRGNRGRTVAVSGTSASRKPLAAGAHRNIVFERNRFEGGCGIALVGCSDCTFAGNSWAIGGEEAVKQGRPPVWAVNCTNLVVDAPVAENTPLSPWNPMWSRTSGGRASKPNNLNIDRKGKR